MCLASWFLVADGAAVLPIASVEASVSRRNPMPLSARLAAVPALAVALAGFTLAPAHATTDALSTEAVGALAVASCQLDPAAPLTVEELAPTVIGESDVELVAGELTAHIVRAQVNTTLAGDPEECTFGVVHRDALLPRVKYEGTATLSLGDGLGGTVDSVATDIELGNMGKASPVDPTPEVVLAGFLAPLGGTVDPAYSFSIDRLALETVPVAVNRAQKDAAAKLLKAQTKAAAQLKKKQVNAAKAKRSAKAVTAANRAYATRLAKAQAAYDRATTPRSVTRPVSHHVTVEGTVPTAG